MKPIQLREEQMIMLDIMKAFAEFCEEHKLRYFLDAGTLLGAVRHHGFIPWDNDADVCMPRPDMDKFFSLLEQRNFMLNDHIILERPEDTIFTFFKLLQNENANFPIFFTLFGTVTFTKLVQL